MAGVKNWHPGQVNTLEFITLSSVCVGACKPTVGCRKGSVNFLRVVNPFLFSIMFAKIYTVASWPNSNQWKQSPVWSWTSWCCFYVMFYWSSCTALSVGVLITYQTIDSELAQEKHWFVIPSYTHHSHFRPHWMTHTDLFRHVWGTVNKANSEYLRKGI